MTVKELLGQLDGQYYDYEVWSFTGNSKRLHSDFIKNIDEELSFSEFSSREVIDYHIMNEEDYNNTICANSCVSADFCEWYEDKNCKILVIMVED